MYDLDRFIDAQEDIYSQVVTELTNQEKITHWMWFIFPQLELGYTEKSKYYSLSGIDEAQAYLNHSLLGARLIECCELLKDSEQSIEDILGADAVKFQSSLTLFSQASDNSIFDELLEQFFAGEKDETSLQILRNNDFQ